MKLVVPRALRRLARATHAFGPVTPAAFHIAGAGPLESCLEDDFGLGEVAPIVGESFVRAFERALLARGVPFSYAGGESLEMSIVGAAWIVCTTAGGLKPDFLTSLRDAHERGIVGHHRSARPRSRRLDAPRSRSPHDVRGLEVEPLDDPSRADALVARRIDELALPAYPVDVPDVHVTVHEDAARRSARRVRDEPDRRRRWSRRSASDARASSSTSLPTAARGEPHRAARRHRRLRGRSAGADGADVLDRDLSAGALSSLRAGHRQLRARLDDACCRRWSGTCSRSRCRPCTLHSSCRSAPDPCRTRRSCTGCRRLRPGPPPPKPPQQMSVPVQSAFSSQRIFAAGAHGGRGLAAAVSRAGHAAHLGGRRALRAAGAGDLVGRRGEPGVVAAAPLPRGVGAAAAAVGGAARPPGAGLPLVPLVPLVPPLVPLPASPPSALCRRRSRRCRRTRRARR